MNNDEAKKWLQLGFETYGLEGLMDVAVAMGLQPRATPSYPRGAISNRQRLSSPIFTTDWGRLLPFNEAIHVASPQLAASKSDCIEKCWRLLERILPHPGSDKNTWDFHKCVNECMGLG
jgi:hypothetical protein